MDQSNENRVCDLEHPSGARSQNGAAAPESTPVRPLVIAAPIIVRPVYPLAPISEGRVPHGLRDP